MALSKSSVSVKDVAALAGVSVGTVSNVINSPDVVSAATRQRVEDAISKLGWVRNESARQLRAGRSRTIGMVVMEIANPFFTDIVAGVEDYVEDLGYTVQLGNSAEQVSREAAHLALFEEHRVRGVLFVPIREVGDRVARLRRHGIPVVVVDRAGDKADYCTVAVDDVEGGRLAVAHLVDLGHQRIAFVGGPSSLQQVRDRSLGAQIAASRLNAAGALLTMSTSRLDTDSGVRAAGEIALMPRPNGRRRCSPRTTCWPSACCRGSSPMASGSRTTSRSSATTTSSSPQPRRFRSRPSANPGSCWAGGRLSCSSQRSTPSIMTCRTSISTFSSCRS